MILRICSRDGVERVSVDNAEITVCELKALIQEQLKIPIHKQQISTDQKILLAKSPADLVQFFDMADQSTRLSSLGICHGSKIFTAYEGERTIAGPSISPAGSFGRKMTMGDLIAKQMRITRQENPHCQSVSFDRESANGFQLYVNETLAFAVKRGGFMYGTVPESGEVKVNFIYEPPQHGTEEDLMLLRDSGEESLVDVIAGGLGMRRVGFIFSQTVSHRSKDYTFSNREVLQAVEVHAASKLKEWVTAVVKLEVNEEGVADVHFEAFQLSDVCVRLFNEDWLVKEIEDNMDPKLSRTNKNVVVGGKDVKEVDNDFFLAVLKIFDHTGPLSSTFPVENRITQVTSKALERHLDCTRNLTFVKKISDFHLLLFLSKFLDLTSDVPALAHCVHEQAAIPEGYQLLIEAIANPC